MTKEERLLDALRNDLDITYEDESGDAKLLGIIARGMNYMEAIAGGVLDFDDQAKPRELLIEYCRYVRANALSDFMVNYRHELLYFQMSEEARRYVEQRKERDEGAGDS